MNVYLLRHGETEWNVIQRIQGQQQVDLNENGRAQALVAAKQLMNFEIQKIYTSDLARSLETAQIINSLLKADLEISNGLREIAYGEWEGKLWETVYNENPYLNHSWENMGIQFTSPCGEKAVDFRNRVIHEFSRIVTNETANSILIVTHGQVIKMILSCFTPVKGSEIFTFMHNGNCECVKINSTKLTKFMLSINSGSSLALLPD